MVFGILFSIERSIFKKALIFLLMQHSRNCKMSVILYLKDCTRKVSEVKPKVPQCWHSINYGSQWMQVWCLSLGFSAPVNSIKHGTTFVCIAIENFILTWAINWITHFWCVTVYYLHYMFWSFMLGCLARCLIFQCGMVIIILLYNFIVTTQRWKTTVSF